MRTLKRMNRASRRGLDRAASAAIETMEPRLFLSGDILPTAAAANLAGSSAEYAPGGLVVQVVDKAPAAAAKPAQTPAAVTSLRANFSDQTSIAMEWSSSGGGSYFDMRYSVTPITEANWENAKMVDGEPTLQRTGAWYTFTITNLPHHPAATRYYVAVKVCNSPDNCSPLSNIAQACTVGDSWNIQIPDASTHAGLNNALAYDPNGNPAIAYDLSDVADVRFAHWNGASWDMRTVESQASEVAGLDLAYAPDGNPSLSYCAETREGWSLKFAHRNGSTDDSDWTKTVIEANVGSPTTSLIYDAAGNALLSYYKSAGDRKSTSALKLARQVGSAWQVETVVAGASARYSSMALDSDGNPSIAYVDDLNKDGTIDALMFVHWNGESWSSPAVVNDSLLGVSMRQVSLAYDPTTENPAIAYRNGSYLYFARYDDTTSTWIGESLGGELLVKGYEPSLAYETKADNPLGIPVGTAFVSYHAGSILTIAQRDPSGTWTTEIVGPRCSSNETVLDADGRPSVSFCQNQPIPIMWNLGFVRKVANAALVAAPAAQQDAAGAQATLSVTAQKRFSTKEIAGNVEADLAQIAVEPEAIAPPKQAMQIDKPERDVFSADEIPVLS